uniref:B(0,+)-type amino acid transporter 1 n=1 Tax=Magallana gigas TaxID=29159 RepID=K1PSJ9_MAGGI
MSLLSDSRTKDCLALFQTGHTCSGVYTIYPTGGAKTDVVCDMKIMGGGWTLIQNRFDGSENFNRNWADYKNGFGSSVGEYWIALSIAQRFIVVRLLFPVQGITALYEQKYTSFKLISFCDDVKQERITKLKVTEKLTIILQSILTYSGSLLRNLPRANVLGVLLVTGIYVLTNISYLAVLGTEGLLNSSAVALEWGEVVLGNRVAVIMPLFVMCSTIGAANGTMFAGGRTLYVAARENQFPEVLSYVNVRRVTPIPCIIFTTVVALLMLIPGDIGSLINFVSFASWMFYSLAIVSLIVFILFPITFLCCSLYLVVAPIIQNPRLEFLYAFLIIIGGLVFYVPFVHFRIHKSCFNPVTLFVQLLMEVGPSSYVPDSE